MKREDCATGHLLRLTRINRSLAAFAFEPEPSPATTTARLARPRLGV